MLIFCYKYYEWAGKKYIFCCWGQSSTHQYINKYQKVNATWIRWVFFHISPSPFFLFLLVFTGHFQELRLEWELRQHLYQVKVKSSQVGHEPQLVTNNIKISCLFLFQLLSFLFQLFFLHLNYLQRQPKSSSASIKLVSI